MTDFLKHIILKRINLEKTNKIFKGKCLGFFIKRGEKWYSVSHAHKTKNGFHKLYPIKKEIVEKHIQNGRIKEINLNFIYKN